MRSLITASAILLLSSPPLLAQRDLKEIPPVDPEIERQSFVLPEGFEVNLFAADPQIAKPIQMNFDPQGRLWLATSQVYPHIKPGQQADDKILVLEDSDGDGMSDKTTVFADGLMIPTGVAPGDGGAYVGNSTQLLHLEDSDGDGRADRERIVLSGFGTEDTHHILHTFRWGPDGCLYFNQSIYIHSHIETPYGVQRLNGGGVWRFHPRTMELEVFARGWINPWGHQFDEFGTSFVTDGAGGQGINYAVPGGAYATAVGVERILPGLNPGSPKYCGLEIVGGSALPKDWQGDLITHDFRGHRVCRFQLERDGSGFTSRQMPDLIRSSHPAFRPVDVAMGPDGAIYIADWYNPIIQHGEVDFRDPRRDQTHGRIWRITYNGKPTLPRQDLTKLDIPHLLDLLKSDEPWQRRQAKRALTERDPDQVHNLLLRSGLDENDPHVERHALERIWLLHAIGRAAPDVVVNAISKATNARVRAAGCRLAGEWIDRDPQVLPVLAEAAADDDPLVRLEAVRALAKERQHVEAVTKALAALDKPVDQWMDYALWLTCRELAPVWLPALKAGEFDFGGDARKMAFALRAVRDPAAVTALTGLIRAGKLPAAQAAEALKVVAELGRPDDLAFVFERALNTESSPAAQADLLERLAEATRRRKARPGGDLGRIVALFDHDDERIRRAAFALAGAWQVEAAREVLQSAAADPDAKPADRRAALTALQGLGGAKSREFFASQAASKKPWPVRADAVAAWAEMNPADAAGQAVALLQGAPEGAAVEPLFAAFVSRKDGPAALTAALREQTEKLPEDVARLGLRAVESSAQSLPKLTAALTESAGITAGPRMLSPEEMRQTLAEVAASGNAARGEAVYRRKSLACLGCHAIGGAGGQVGPDLVSLGGSAPVDYIVDSLLQPNKAVKENYHSLVIATDSGRVLTGVKVRQSDAEVILRDAEDRIITVPLDSVVGQKVGQSLMPAGLTEKLTRQEFLDLVRFLSELGKVDGLAPEKTETARRWRVLLPTDEAKHQLRRTGYETAATDDPAFTWEPAYSRVDGTLPLEDVPVLNQLQGPRSGEPLVAFARTEIEVTRPGTVRLELNDTAGLHAWIGRTPVVLDDEIRLELASGRHRLTFAIHPAERESGLEVRLHPGTASDAAARFVLGK